MKAFTLTCGFFLVALFFSQGYCEKHLDGSDLDHRILQEVSNHMGTRYKRGGSSKSGVDCSGFVRLVYRHVFQVDLPYIAAYQSRLPIFRDIPFEDLKTGDLIFFSRTPQKKGINHVGIYLAEGEFAHAIEKKGVTISSLNKAHWKLRIKKLKRIKTGTHQ